MIKFCSYCKVDTHNDNECWSTRPANWHPDVATAVAMDFLKPKSGFEPDPQSRICRDPGHEAPTMLHVPAGQRYRHVCPRCGFTVILRSHDTYSLGDPR